MPTVICTSCNSVQLVSGARGKKFSEMRCAFCKKTGTFERATPSGCIRLGFFPESFDDLYKSKRGLWQVKKFNHPATQLEFLPSKIIIT